MTWGAITLLLGTCALIVQTLAWVIAVAVSLGVTALAHRIESRTTSAGSGTRASKAPPPGGSSGRGRGGGGGGTGRQKSAQVINCLESGLQAAPKRVCRKHPRHVVSQDGVTRFNKPLGSPLT